MLTKLRGVVEYLLSANGDGGVFSKSHNCGSSPTSGQTLEEALGRTHEFGEPWSNFFVTRRSSGDRGHHFHSKKWIVLTNGFHCLHVHRTAICVSHVENVDSLITLCRNVSSSNRQTILSKYTRHISQETHSVTCAELQSQTLKNSRHRNSVPVWNRRLKCTLSMFKHIQTQKLQGVHRWPKPAHHVILITLHKVTSLHSGSSQIKVGQNSVHLRGSALNSCL